ncbi:MAG: substrate-binding domain-containing protein [Thermodesulfovibrionales bacterium]|jgi:phosphate transport system substrate-binding protein
MFKQAIIILAAFFAVSGTATAETVTIHGSSTTMGKIISKIKEPFEKATGIELSLLANGSGAGAKDLLEGKCDASMASESLTDLKKAVPELNNIPNLQEHLLANDTIAVIVNKQNPIAKLSKDQLKGLNTGKIKNWKEVGGMDADIIVVTSVKGSGTRSTFEKQVMDGTPYVADAIEAATTMAEVKEVSTMKEAIGAVSDSFVDETVKTVETPAIGRPLIFVTKGAPSPATKKLLDFIKTEGPKYYK